MLLYYSTIPHILTTAVINILLGLFRLSRWVEMENRHLIRKSLYLCGSLIGLISMMFFFLNVYRLIYHKRAYNALCNIVLFDKWFFYKGVPRPQDQAGGDEDTKELVKNDTPAPAPVCIITTSYATSLYHFFFLHRIMYAEYHLE